jgi:hypothetical protein
MPERFRTASVFEPRFVELLVDVFGQACAEAERLEGGCTEQRRDVLAKALMAEAQLGTKDPSVLKARALAKLGVP